MRRAALNLAVMVASLVPAITQAQSINDLRDDQLLNQVVTATVARDADALLAIMIEVESRNLLMFAVNKQKCDAIVPETGLLDNMMSRGTARSAYIVRARQAAMAEGSCSCIFSSISFDAFTQELVGKTAPNLTGADLQQMLSFRRKFEHSVRTEYLNHRRNICGKG